MKKILLILLILFPISLAGQKNTLSVSLLPVDLGIGIRYDRQFRETGLYCSVSHGNYNPEIGYIKNHWKFSLGGITYHRADRAIVFLSFGGNYHTFGDYDVPPEMFLTTALNTISCEVGGGAKMGLIAFAFRVDPIKWESSFDIGIVF